MSLDLIKRLRARKYRAKAILGFISASDASLMQEAADRIAALEAEASEGVRRGLERALEFAKFEAKAWGFEQGSSARVAAANIERAIHALIPEAPVREGWRPISSAPKDDPLRSILIATRGYVGGVVQVAWSDTKQDFVDQDEDTYPDAEYWMPMPPPPQDHREG